MMLAKRSSSSRNSFTDDESDWEENPFMTKKNSSRKKSYKKWTKEEDDRLKDYINSHGGLTNWSRISQYVGNGRTDAQCQHRWERFLDPSITKGPWTDEEDKKVIELVRDYGARQWSLIAKELKGRVGKQCRERWHNHLNPAINKNPWTNDENLLLFILHQHFGNKWAEIAKYFNGRSDNSIKNHWNSSMKKKFELEVANLKRQGLEWTTLIPADFPWPKLEKSSSTRAPLSTITNRPIPKRSNKEKQSTRPIVNSDTNAHHFYSPTTDHNNFNIPPIYPDPMQPPPPPLPASQSTSSSQRSSQDLERLFYCTPPSPAKQLPMLSSCADYTSSSQNSHHLSLFPSRLEFYSSPTATNRPIYTSDDSFSLSFNSQNETKQEPEPLIIDLTHAQPSADVVISPKTSSNHSSPSKHRVLNTPERLDRPHRIHLPDHDWFNDLLSSYPDPVTTITPNNPSTSLKRTKRHQSTTVDSRRRLFDSSKKLKEELGYDPTYTEILTGQTRDQRHVTEQARRYLSCSSLNH